MILLPSSVRTYAATAPANQRKSFEGLSNEVWSVLTADPLCGHMLLFLNRRMQDIAFGVEQFTLPEYIDWVVQNAAKFEEVELKVTGETDEEKAASLVAEMIRKGLTKKM